MLFEAAAREGKAPDLETEGQRLPIGGFLGSLPSGPLVAREEELRKALGVLEVATRGEGRLVLLAGEPGAGKTRLAQEVTLHARDRGFLIAAGSCFEPRESVPYYPFLDVLTTLYNLAPPAIRSQAVQRWPYLARLFPDIGILPPPEASGQEDQELLFRSFAGIIQAVSELVHVAVLLDDLHWADSASLDLLQHLARHTRAHRVFLLGAYRDVEVRRDHPLQRALVDLGRQGLVERISVRRLGQEGTEALIAATFEDAQISDDFAQLIQQRTDGNPFFVQEVLRALVERGDIYRADGRWERRAIGEIEVPESVRAAIGQRLSRLREATQSILLEASVLGQTFAFDDLTALGHHKEDEIEEALEEATAVGVTQAAERDAYAFNHALTQQELYAELSPRRKRKLHLAAGEALERLPAEAREKRAAELAWHFLQGDDAERALPYTVLAGDQAVHVLAYSEAMRHYRTASELAGELGDSEHEAAALEKLGLMLNQFLRYDESIEALGRAEELYRGLGDVDAAARVVVPIARAYAGKADYESSLARLDSLIESYRGRPPLASLAAAHENRAGALLWSGHAAEALAASDEAVKVASAAGDTLILLQAQLGRGIALSWLGRELEAMAEFEDILPRAEAHGDLQVLSRALMNLGDSCLHQGRFDRAQACWERSLALVTSGDSHNPAAAEMANLSELHFYLGNWAQARGYAESALDMARPTNVPWYAFWPLSMLATLCLVQGEWDSAAQYLEECRATAHQIGRLLELRWAEMRFAELDLLQNHPERAIGRLEPLLDQADRQGHDLTPMLPTLAWAYLDNGDSGRAVETVRTAIERATAQGNRLVLADAFRVQGMALTHQQRWDEATAAFDEAISLTRPMPYPYAESRTLYESGIMEMQRGDASEARERLQKAQEIFLRLDAQPYCIRTVMALEKLGSE